MSALEITVCHADAAQLLTRFAGGRVSLINADPPYGIGKTESRVMEYTVSKAMADKRWVDFHAAWDVIPDYLNFSLRWMEAARDALDKTGNLLVWGTNQHNIHHIRAAVDLLGMWCVQGLYWTKTNNMPNLSKTQFSCATEVILWVRKSKKRGSYYDHTVSERYPFISVKGAPLINLRDYFLYPAETHVGNTWKFPSRKPIVLTSLLIDALTPKGKDVTIIDPFAGSGTTAIAAQAVPGLQGNVYAGDLDRGSVDNILVPRLKPIRLWEVPEQKQRDGTVPRRLAFVSAVFERKVQDIWVGAYWNTEPGFWRGRVARWIHIWICFIPCLPLHITLAKQDREK